MKMEQSVPKRRNIKFRRRGITQQKTYRIVSVKHNFVYSLIIVEFATCFDPAGSSSGLYVSQVMIWYI
jgi:hypothetical protein